MRLIAGCKHAGGVIQTAGVNHDQAIKILDQRCWSSEAPEFDSGEEATKLYTMVWPVELSVDAYNSLYNRAISAATRINMNPTTEIDADIALRSTWWHVIAKPPADSPYYSAAQQARAVTRQECTSVAHRNAWHAAIIKEITTMVQAGANRPTGARGVAARSASAHLVTDSPGDASCHIAACRARLERQAQYAEHLERACVL